MQNRWKFPRKHQPSMRLILSIRWSKLIGFRREEYLHAIISLVDPEEVQLHIWNFKLTPQPAKTTIPQTLFLFLNFMTTWTSVLNGFLVTQTQPSMAIMHPLQWSLEVLLRDAPISGPECNKKEESATATVCYCTQQYPNVKGRYCTAVFWIQIPPYPYFMICTQHWSLIAGRQPLVTFFILFFNIA